MLPRARRADGLLAIFFRVHSASTLLSAGLLACVHSNPVRLAPDVDYGEKAGRVWVRGPWEAITPSSDIDEVIDQLCPAVERLEGSRDGDDGTEYCGLLYSLPDGMFYASVPSPLGLLSHAQRGRHKSCRIPLMVRDDRAPPRIACDFHSHPWPDAPFSDGDLSTQKQKWSIRIQFDTTCRVYKYVPHLGEDRPGEVFLRVGKTWRLESIVRTGDKPYGKPTPALGEVR